MVRLILRGVGVIVLAAALLALAWQVSPLPSALFYRYLFDKGGVAMHQALAPHVPAGVTSTLDLAYGPGPDERLDLHRPASDNPLPVVLWIHGGGFISGDKGQLANYLKIIAAKGYAVVGINYTLAPSAQHPVPTRQANAALAYLTAHAAELGLDPTRLVLAGDSAGAQVAAQLALALNEPAYAAALGIAPSVPGPTVKGVVLDCGIFDASLLDASGAMAGFLHSVAWSYFGTKDLAHGVPDTFSITANLTARMPPLFITAGNADPLLPHSQSLATRAAALGIPTETLFFPADHDPPLPHEYELNLDTDAGQEALARTLDFIGKVSAAR